MSPTVPVLLQILSGEKNASDLLPAGSIYPLEPNKSVELTIPGGVIGGPVSVPYWVASHTASSHSEMHYYPSLAPCSPAWTRVFRSPQRRKLVSQLCRSCDTRRREYRRHGRQCHHPVPNRQPWPLVLPLPHRLALERVRDPYFGPLRCWFMLTCDS